MTLSFRCRVLLFLLSSAVCAAAAAPLVSVPRFTHPGAGQVFYFLLTDRFANGSTANDTGGIAGGAEDHGFDPTRISHFHGGDFAGLTAKLDYIKGLGATAVWVTPPFRNKPVQTGSAAYHGYWILDFLAVDPHLGTDAEFREFVAQAHARGLKVYLDIIVNHTADVIQPTGGDTRYVSKTVAPYRDATGRAFDERSVAFNGVNAVAFPPLARERSFAYAPLVPPAEATAKNPAWLNDVTLYHNRGNSTFDGESSLDGDFVGLDDTFTEHPAVVRGFIDIYRHWIERYGVDGFRIDTARHVNLAFWHAFAPAMRESARRAGRPGFIQFGEVANDARDVPLLAEFSTTAALDATLDFGFFRATQAFLSPHGSATDLAALFAQDDLYTDHDGNVHASTTFLGNHDAGRFAYFLQKDEPGASRERLAELVPFGHTLLFLVRGQPVIYYGDEQGMIGRGGHDMQAREDMFAARAPDFKNAALLGTTRTGADDKFDPQHPFYRHIRALAALRARHAALRHGAMLVRPAPVNDIFAFSRIERGERVEYLAACNRSRTARATAQLQTSQPASATLQRLRLPDGEPMAAAAALTADGDGRVTIELGPLEFALWRAAVPLPAAAAAPTVAFAAPRDGATLAFPTREFDGHTFIHRQELRAEVRGGDGVGEMTFVLQRASRPQHFELLGTDDTPPYRIFWRPPADLAADETLTFIATFDDLRGHRAAAQIGRVRVAPAQASFGIAGATVPKLATPLPPEVSVAAGGVLTLGVEATGTAPLEFQWLRDGAELPGATAATLSVPNATPAAAGRYSVLVRNREGTALSTETRVVVKPGR